MTLLEMSSVVFLGACVAVASTFGAQWIGWPGGVLGACAAIAAIYGFIKFSMAMEDHPPCLAQGAQRLFFVWFWLIVVFLEAATVIGLYYCSRHIGFAAVLLSPLVLLGAIPVSWILAGNITSLVESGSANRGVMRKPRERSGGEVSGSGAGDEAEEGRELMITRRRFIVASATVCVVAAVIVFGAITAILAFGRGGSAVPTATTSTPDHQTWTLSTSLNVDGTRVALISDASQQVVFTGSMRFSDYSRWFVHDGAGEFWIYSGDIGILHYTRGPDGTWAESPWVRGPTAAIMPRAFYSQLSKSIRTVIDPENVGP